MKGLLFVGQILLNFITFIRDCIKLAFEASTHPVEVNLSISSPVELRLMMPSVVLGGDDF